MYPGRGVYLLKFDNSYSLWRSKTLYYRVYYTRWTITLGYCILLALINLNAKYGNTVGLSAELVSCHFLSEITCWCPICFYCCVFENSLCCIAGFALHYWQIAFRSEADKRELTGACTVDVIVLNVTRVPAPPVKSWNLYWKISRTWKVLEIYLQGVRESPGIC